MGNPNATYNQVNRARLEAAGLDARGKDDTVLNVAYVYCHAHCKPHSTGWCTVSLVEKTPLDSKDFDSALAETRALGFWVYGDPWVCADCGETITRDVRTTCAKGRGSGHRQALDD